MKQAIKLIVFVFLLFSMFTSFQMTASGGLTNDWPMYRHDSANTGNSLACWAPNTNQTLWNVSLGDEIFSSPVVYNGKVFVGSWSYQELTWWWHPLTVPVDGKFYCLDEKTGAIIWNCSTVGFIYSSPACVDGKVYFGSENGNIFCLDANTGQKLWTYPAGYSVLGSPVVTGDRLYISSRGDHTFCLNASNGVLQWSYPAGYNAVGSSPAVVNDKVYLCAPDNKTYCLNAFTGDLLWSYQTGASALCPTVVDGFVYFGSGDHNVYCLNAQNGALNWKYTAGSAFGNSAPAICDGKLYVGSSDHSLYCIDTQNGKPIWSLANASFSASPSVGDGKVYITSYEGKLHCLDADTGILIWYYNGGNYAYSSPVIVDGRLYAAFSDPGTLVCFGSLIRPTPIEEFSTNNLTITEMNIYTSIAILIPLLVMGTAGVWLLLRRKNTKHTE